MKVRIVPLPPMESPPDDFFKVARHVSAPTQCMLWGKAAGRCEFNGCNKPLWKSSITQEQVSIAQKAHIYSFSQIGPRGHAQIDKRLLNEIENLILICHECHQKIDRDKSGMRFSAALLREMKLAHEQRIERVGGITEGATSHVLLYGANVGHHSSPLSYREAASAMFPERYPATDTPIELSTTNGSFSDRDSQFWAIEAESLLRKFRQRVKERISSGEVEHLSVFSIAPQPLLVLLGTLLGDIVPADVYQRHREPATWEWPLESPGPAFELRRPGMSTGVPALVLELSATVSAERIHRALGTNNSIWSISIPSPHNDITKSRRQVSEFRALARMALEQIKAAHGQRAILHIFPVMPVSLAVELGRVRMPKADMTWQIYDQVNSLGGFVPALSVPYGEGRQ